jgi:hypothetical protein
MDKKNSAGWKVIERARRKSPPSWGAELLGILQREVVATTHQKHTGPGGELNRKLWDKWQALRRNPHYRRERDAEFQAYVDGEIIKVEESKELLEAHMDPLLKPYLRKPLVNQDSRVEDFQKWWPQEQAETDFLFSTEGLKLAIKFGLQLPRHYDDPIWNPEEETAPSVFYNANFAVQVITHADAVLKPISEHESILDISPHLEAGRFLTLKIDLKNPKTQIMAEVDYAFEKYHKLAFTGKKTKVRGKSVNDFDWKAWDMCHNEDKSAWQITKELYPDITSRYSQSSEIDGDTEGGVDGGMDRMNKYTPEAKKARRYWRKVERAIERAQEKIDSLNPTI